MTYLSKTLAKSLNDLESSQAKLKEFTLENNALPLESFTAGSFQLDSLREQLKHTSELLEAVAALSLMLQNNTTNQDNYLTLRQQFPIIDQVEFRRVLGQNEIISSWSWPEAGTLKVVSDTLSERKGRLQTQINASLVNVESLGLAVEAYNKLERNAKVAEASYKVLIEQVKAQSIVAGFRPDKTEIFEYGTAPINPSSPNRNLILALGATLGLLLGTAISLILANHRGVYYSKKLLIFDAQVRLTASMKSLLPLRNKSLKDLNLILTKKPSSILREFAVEIYKKSATQVVITSTCTKMTGNDLARALSSYMQSDTIKVAVINFSSKAKKLNIDDKSLSIGSFVIAESVGQISVLMPDNDLEAMEMLSRKDFWQNIQLLNSTFDLLFLCADNGDAISLLSALENQKMFHVTLARTKKTKSAAIIKMRSLLPIIGLLHD
jgi:hypothetical protein